MTPGTPMLRLEDGRMGRVELVSDEPRVVWVDRGTRIVAPKREKWVPYENPPSQLREEERLEVAMEADRALRAIEKHEPRRFWQPPDLNATPHDPGLVAVIVEYLKERA